jgi:hypothetical protein
MRIIFLLLISTFLLSPVFANSKKYLPLPYYASSSSLPGDLKSLREFIVYNNEALLKETKIEMIKPSNGVTPPTLTGDEFTSESFLRNLFLIGKKEKADYVLCGTVSKIDKIFKVTTFLYSIEDIKIAYSSTLYVYPEDKGYSPSFDIVGRINLFQEGKTFPVRKLTPTNGNKQQIAPSLSWEAVPECPMYGVYRSRTKDGVYMQAGIVSTTTFIDQGGDPGIKYYYAIAPFYNGIRTELSEPVQAYKKPSLPKDRDLKKLIESFNKPRPKLSGEASAKAAKHISMIKEIYFNKVKLNIIIYISRSYIERKELFVYTDFNKFIIDKENRRITLISDKEDYELFFDNNTFFTRIVNQNDDDLNEILVRNAVYFCEPVSEKEKILENGETVVVPVFEVASMCTQYFKNNKDWQENTMVFATKNQELRKRMEDARTKNDTINNNND